METGIVQGDPSGANYLKLGVGGWYNTGHFEDAVTGKERESNGGVYAIAERAVTEQLGLFVQLGTVQADRNKVGAYAGAGLNYKSLILEDDVFGLAVAHARNGSEYRDAQASSVDSAETTIELTYHVPLCDRFTIQPSLQYVINPGMDRDIDDAIVFGLRLVGAY